MAAKIRTKSQLEDHIREYLEIEGQIKALQVKSDNIKASIQEYIGNREKVVTENFTLHYPHVSSSRMDIKRFQKEFPKLYAMYLTTTHFRRFTIKD